MKTMKKGRKENSIDSIFWRLREVEPLERFETRECSWFVWSSWSSCSNLDPIIPLIKSQSTCRLRCRHDTVLPGEDVTVAHLPVENQAANISQPWRWPVAVWILWGHFDQQRTPVSTGNTLWEIQVLDIGQTGKVWQCGNYKVHLISPTT